MQCNIIEAIARVNNEKNLLWKSVVRLSSKSKTDVMLVQCNAVSLKQSQALTIKKKICVRAESVTQSRRNSHDRLMSRRFHGLVYFWTHCRALFARKCNNSYTFDPNLGEGLCIFTSFHFLDSGLYLSNGFDFYFDLFWMAWHWKPAILIVVD